MNLNSMDVSAFERRVKRLIMDRPEFDSMINKIEELLKE
jgi:hypothetical protein